MTLFLDIGNSRLKWLLFSCNKQNQILIAKNGSVFIDSLLQSNNLIEETLFFRQITKNIRQIQKELGNKISFEHKYLKNIVWLCVGPKVIEKKVIAILSRLYSQKPPKKIVTPKNGKFKLEMDWGKVDLKCNYDQPNKFGADRWAALIGLASLGPPNVNSVKTLKEVILVSAGTATVIDRVLWRRRASRTWFCELSGGIIFPGFNQMFLDMNFVRKFSNQKNGRLEVNPRNTIDAITTGIASCQVLFENRKDVTIVVHGGKTDKWVKSYMFFNPTNARPVESPWIVFEGLYLINKKNGEKIWT